MCLRTLCRLFHISTHTCICFQKNESIFNPKNQWEQITCGMCEIFWWELSWTSPDFFGFFLYLLPIFQSILGTHEFLGSQKALKDAVASIGFCTASKNVANFQFLAWEFKNVSEEANHAFGDINITWFHKELQDSTWSCPQPWIFGQRSLFYCVRVNYGITLGRFFFKYHLYLWLMFSTK
jgi:hypothetical protein